MTCAERVVLITLPSGRSASSKRIESRGGSALQRRAISRGLAELDSLRGSRCSAALPSTEMVAPTGLLRVRAIDFRGKLRVA